MTCRRQKEYKNLSNVRIVPEVWEWLEANKQVGESNNALINRILKESIIAWNMQLIDEKERETQCPNQLKNQVTLTHTASKKAITRN